jgi:lipoic acid synthetase
VARAATTLGLDFVVVTSVTRDDLPDGGAAHFAETVRALRRGRPDAGVEVLVPDFGGSHEAADFVLESGPDVFGHNLETVARLYRDVRRGADYERSLGLLSRAAGAEPRPLVKTALMLGLGETREELERALQDALEVGVRILSLGQYLRPTVDHQPVARFVPPAEFDEIAEMCLSMGFGRVSAGPLVRSSYRAQEAAEALSGRRPSTATACRERSGHEDQGHLQTL